MQRVEAKKGLGQHFLTDKNIAAKIVGSIQGNNYQTVVEIGPGMGILTGFLLQMNLPGFYAVELDREAVAYLSTHFPEYGDRFIQGDFLTHPLDTYPGPLVLIGNLPYFISSQIFFKALEHRHQVDQMIFMVQKEVAERIAAPPGSRTYGILSVLLQAYYTIDYLFTVHEHCFSPAPKVKSAVIRLRRNARERLECRHEDFHRVVKSGFNQRRKILRNSLKSIFLHLPDESPLLLKRPEQLTVEQFAELTRMLVKLNP